MKTLLKSIRPLLITLGAILLLPAHNLYAEALGTVEGSVVDAENQKTIEAATVELLNKADTSLVKGVITDENGNYNFDQIPSGEYLLRFSFLGYNVKMDAPFTITPTHRHVKFTQTSLFADSKTLQEVSVYGRMLTGAMHDDKTVYNITPEAAEISTSALELLRQVPDVNVDYMSNEVTLEGSSNILFLVNGRKVDRDYLRQLNPELIDRYEIVTNPGVKYEADVDGVINVIMKRNFQYGVSGAVNVEVPTSTQSFFSYSNANVDYYKNGLRLFVNGYGGGNRWDFYMDRNRDLHDDPANAEVQRYSKVDILNSYTGMSYGFDWFIDDKNTLNFSSSLHPRTPNSIDSGTDSYSINDTSTITKYDNYYNLQRDLYNDYSLYYQRNLNKPGHDFSTELFYSTNSKLQDLEFTDRVVAPEATKDTTTKQFSENNKDMFRAKVDYNYPINSWLKLSVGASNVNTFFDNSHAWSSDDKQNLKYDEYRLSGYSNLSASIKKHNFQAGLRYESSNIDINHTHLTYDTTASGHYGEWLPYLSYNTKLGERHSLRLNYRKSITRPGMNQVNPFVQIDDPYYTSSGNIDLHPSKSHKIEMSHRIKIYGPLFITYRPFVQYQNDVIAPVNTLNDAGVLARKQQNVGEVFSYGVGINANLAFSKWWNIIPDFNWTSYDFYEAEQYDIIGKNENSYSWGIRNNFVLPKELYLFVNYEHNGEQYTHQGSSTRGDIFVTGFYKKINKNWALTAFTVNPFLHKYTTNEATTTGYGFTEKEISHINYSHIVNVKISYNFNVGKEVKKLNRSVDGDNEATKGGGMF